MDGNIDKLIKLIATHFVFDEKTYPELKDASDEQRLKFAIKHLALHFAKTAGKISAVSENLDHGEKINFDELKTNIPKALINTLRLAEALHVTEDELIAAIEEKYKDKLK